MDLVELQDLLRDLLQAVQTVIASGEEMSDELQGEIARTLEVLYTRIEALSNQEAPPTPPNLSEIEPAMPSSNVEGFAYDQKNNRLLVRFLGEHPNRNGPIYSYSGVPPSMFDLFRRGAVPARTDGKNKWGKWWKGKVPSMGASVYTLLRLGGFPYQKVA